MRRLSPDELLALATLHGPGATFDATTPHGAKLDRGMLGLVDRGAAVYRRPPGSRVTTFTVTDQGRLAWRIALATAGCW